MRLLHTRTLELQWFNKPPEYAILSHRWSDNELTFEANAKSPICNRKSHARSLPGFSKVQGTCALAARDGFDWVWIDSFCIDKSSSAELQESINSMFNWYAEAQLCYVYLSDVPDEAAGWSEAFGKSQWYTRGWTLQELVAPHTLEFYAADWSLIGSKSERYREIAEITGIATRALTTPWYKIKHEFVAAEKLSWAAHRQTSRGEDQSYSLLGLFDINIPMLYGEGRQKAFQRLQLAIYDRDSDQSLFLYKPGPWLSGKSLLSDATHKFCQNSNCLHCSINTYHDLLTYANLRLDEDTNTLAKSDRYLKAIRLGTVAKLPVVKLEDLPKDSCSLRGNLKGHVAILNVIDSKLGRICLPLCSNSETGGFHVGTSGLCFLSESIDRSNFPHRSITSKVDNTNQRQSTYISVEHRICEFKLTLLRRGKLPKLTPLTSFNSVFKLSLEGHKDIFLDAVPNDPSTSLPSFRVHLSVGETNSLLDTITMRNVEVITTPSELDQAPKPLSELEKSFKKNLACFTLSDNSKVHFRLLHLADAPNWGLYESRIRLLIWHEPTQPPTPIPSPQNARKALLQTLLKALYKAFSQVLFKTPFHSLSKLPQVLFQSLSKIISQVLFKTIFQKLSKALSKSLFKVLAQIAPDLNRALVAQKKRRK